jgi:hypothetical protein
MSARKIDASNVFSPTTSQGSQTRLTLPAHSVRIRKSGIEFRAPNPIPPWTEMTVDLQSPRNEKKVHCTGVVITCNGNRSTGYVVSMLFTNLSRQSQALLSSLAYS